MWTAWIPPNIRRNPRCPQSLGQRCALPTQFTSPGGWIRFAEIQRPRPGTDRMNRVHFSSETDRWATPQRFFDKLNNEFGFTVDVCATPENAKCARYFSLQIDGLKQKWQGVCWMNPPYGREIGRWMRKAYESALNGTTVVCLVPARTDTSWWHDYAVNASEIRFIRGRLKFGNSKDPAPFPSALIIIRGARAGRESADGTVSGPGGKLMKNAFATAVFGNESRSVPSRPVILGRLRGVN